MSTNDQTNANIELQLREYLRARPYIMSEVLIDVMTVLGANRTWGEENAGDIVAEICQRIETPLRDGILYAPSCGNNAVVEFWRELADEQGIPHDAKAELPAESGPYIDASGEIIVFDYAHYTAWNAYGLWDTQDSIDKQVLLNAGPYTKLVPERIDGS